MTNIFGTNENENATNINRTEGVFFNFVTLSNIFEKYLLYSNSTYYIFR